MRYLLIFLLLFICDVQAHDNYDVDRSSPVFGVIEALDEIVIQYGKCEEIGLYHCWSQYYLISLEYCQMCRNCKLKRIKKGAEWIYLEEEKDNMKYNINDDLMRKELICTKCGKKQELTKLRSRDRIADFQGMEVILTEGVSLLKETWCFHCEKVLLHEEGRELSNDEELDNEQ